MTDVVELDAASSIATVQPVSSMTVEAMAPQGLDADIAALVFARTDSPAALTEIDGWRNAASSMVRPSP